MYVALVWQGRLIAATVHEPTSMRLKLLGRFAAAAHIVLLYSSNNLQTSLSMFYSRVYICSFILTVENQQLATYTTLESHACGGLASAAYE